MLKFVIGRTGSGKSEYVFNEIKNIVKSGVKDVLLLTPEQYSLIAERRLLNDLGEDMVNFVDNSSFSRISNDVRRKYGSSPLPTISKGGKVILMCKAIDECKDDFQLFNKNLDSLSFVSSMINIYDEMKSCNLDSTQITELSKNIENEVLFKKLFDISLIINSYENIIKDKFNDGSSELNRIYNQICDKNYFKDKYVFIDGFNGFVAQEYKLIELIINEAKCVTITLCTDNIDNIDNYSLFTYVNNSAKIIKKIADKANVEVNTVKLDKNYRFNNDELKTVEKSFFDNKSNLLEENKNVKIYASKNISDECENVSRQIKMLLRNGCKANEIAVISRDLDKYLSELEYNFSKYEVPYFKDERQPINTQALVIMIEFMLRCINFSYKSDDILSLAKTGLTDISDEDINELENYVFLWNINGLKWTKPFINSSKGFADEINEYDQKALDKINLTREKLIKPLEKFKQAAKSKDSKSISEAIYYTLISYKADEKVKEYATELDKNGFYALANEQGRVWDLVMNILNQLATTLGETNLKTYAQMFSLIISCEDLGVIPSGIDNVQIGQADRIRTDNPKAVFILGANESEFPQSVNGGGLISESERKIMLENDFKLYSYGEIINLQERYFAYMACCASSDKIFISYLKGNGKDSSPSEIVTDIEAKYKNFIEYDISKICDIDLIETYKNSFELMSEHFYDNTEFYQTLKAYFEDDSKFDSIEYLAKNKPIQIKNKKTATDLFGKDMYISASRIEDYFNCPFRYFCKFGLNARPRVKAEIDPMQRGTLIHYVLEMILSDIGTKKLSTLEYKEIKKLVDKYIAVYFDEHMSSVKDKNKRFDYNYKRLSKLIYDVVNHLAIEFKTCDFEAKAFEMSIDKDGEVKPEVLPLEDGGTIQIRGSIDRVDLFEHDGTKYVRVVDYKSGNKKFKLADIIDGLNLQMFVYLFSLCEDKNSKLNGIPAGVLYMHASRNIINFDSLNEAQKNLDSEENDMFKMNGVVLADDDNLVAGAMEHKLEGKHIPVSLKSNGDIKGSLASLEQLGLIHKKINSLIEKMGNELQNGNIYRAPVENANHKNTCEFCDYSDVCANSKIINKRVCEQLSETEVIERLYKEFGQNAELDTATE